MRRLFHRRGVFCRVRKNGTNPAPGETVLERIEVTRMPTKTEYTEGESFSRSGMVVTAYYSDGTSSPVLGYSVDKTGALSVGDTTVTITYREKTTTVAITVKPREIVAQLEITSSDPYTYKVEAEDCSLASEELGEPKDTYIERPFRNAEQPQYQRRSVARQTELLE